MNYTFHSYTRKNLSMDISGSKYFLPFDADVKDDEILEKTMKLFSDTKIYERQLYTDRKNENLLIEYGNIKMNCLYEGSDDYYPFSFVFDVFRLNDENNKKDDKKWMVAMLMEHEYGGLLDELLEIRTIPKMISSLGLKEYTYL